MREQCQLIGMQFTHPTPNLLVPTLTKLALDLDLVVGETISIKAIIQCPKGIITI